MPNHSEHMGTHMGTQSQFQCSSVFYFTFTELDHLHVILTELWKYNLQ